MDSEMTAGLEGKIKLGLITQNVHYAIVTFAVSSRIRRTMTVLQANEVENAVLSD